MTAWQSMETAPRDGSEIQLRMHSGLVLTGTFFDGPFPWRCATWLGFETFGTSEFTGWAE